jgi:rhodanese-related sulfurtransferase
MKKHFLLLTLGAALLSVDLFAAKAMTPKALELLEKAQKSVPSLSPKEFHKMIDEDADFIQLDIRENDENSHGEIWSFNKVYMTRGYLEYKIEGEIPDKNTNIVVVCCSGKRAALAAKTMQELGYKNVKFLHGGVGGWLHAGYPLDTVFGELWLKK